MDNNNNNNDGTLQYLRSQEKNRILTAVIIKIILSAIAGFALMKTMPLNFTNVVIGCLVFAFTYDVCCVYQFSLRLTCNYIMALFVAVAILCGFFYLYDMANSKLGWLDKQYSTVMEHVITIVIIAILLIPLILNIRSIIKLSK